MPFGVKFYTEGILVVDFCDVDTAGQSECVNCNPARDAGIRMRDVIVGINGQKPATAASLTRAVEESEGRPITLTVKRHASSKDRAKGISTTRENELTITVTPVRSASENRYKTGLWVRDSGAGIGTVTFVTEKGNTFAGLGHGICDGESGALIPLSRGSVMGVTIGSITRGAVGAPGELKGHFSAGKIGSLLGNTVCGVYGVLAELPELPAGKCEIAYKSEVKEGAATVWCTLDDNVCRSYTVQLSQIHRMAEGNKCFTVKVTDEALLARTGGIVQGMSGSPILQDGRLVGAITHVLIGDPTTGYGIFIENMLENMPQALG
jgi:stage IV sporulation protein B